MLLAARHVMTSPGTSLGPGWVRVRAGRVEALGEGTPPPPQDEEQLVELPDALLMPGLVMAHTHVEFGFFRAHADGQGFVPWIRALTARRQACSDEFLGASARLSAAELVASGVTGVGEACTHGQAAVEALVGSGLRAVCYLEEFGPAPGDAPAVLARLGERLDELVELARGSRVRVGISPHAPYTVSLPLLEGMLDTARAREMDVSMHLAETRAEHEYVAEGRGLFAELWAERGIATEARGRGPYADLMERGLAEGLRSLLLVHGVELTPADLADLGRRERVHLVHCPRSNARLGCGVAPVREALDAGVSVLLGTDGACSADRLDPFEEMRAALWLARAKARDPGALSTVEVLAAAQRGHRALGFGPGRLEAGAPADLCAVSLEGPSGIPFEASPKQLVLQATAQDVVLTMVGGEVLYSGGRFTRPEVTRALEEARELARGLPLA